MVDRLIATQFNRMMATGRTSPLLCRCEREDGQPAGEYVVKLLGSVDTREGGMLSELVASRLALHFGILVPEPAVVEVTSTFGEIVASATNPRIAHNLGLSTGLNFGCRLLTGAGTWPVNKAIPDGMHDSALDIFAFDALIQNPDRRRVNPNLLARGDNVFIYDHEAAFSFLLDVLPSRTPWALERENYLEEHVFYKGLKSKALDTAYFEERLRSLTDQVLARIRSEIPTAWINRNLEKIEDHLRDVREHAAEFAEAVKRRLA